MQISRRRKFTEEEKSAIVEEAAQRGVSLVLRDHQLSYSVFSRWKTKFHPKEVKERQAAHKILQQLKEVTAENERLKKIIANQALEIQIITEKLGEESSRPRHKI